MTPHLTPTATAAIRAGVAIHGPHLEVTFRATWDATARAITNAEPVFFGNREESRGLPEWFQPGDIALHTHPEGGLIIPSRLDLDNAVLLLQHGIGAAVASADGLHLHLIAPPPPPKPPHQFRTRMWALGPLTLLWMSRIPHPSGAPRHA